MSRAYFNEIDPFAARWLRNLIAAGHIAPGDVDERSIADVRPDDLRGYTQCHFFVGIGGWSLALRLAGWPDDRPVWTGSCPCQPFSAAGKGKAADDERHLWPVWFPLIKERRPSIVFGEQVEAAIGWGWLDAVFADLEAEGYACGASVLPACGVGAPHIRQRTWFVADALHAGRAERGPQSRNGQTAWSGGAGKLADADGGHASAERQLRSGQQRQQPQDCGVGGLGNPDLARSQGHGHAGQRAGECAARPSGCALEWRNAGWLPCTDGKSRPVPQSVFLRLADDGGEGLGLAGLPADAGNALTQGFKGRAGALKAFGNAIVPALAAEFIRAFMECRP